MSNIKAGVGVKVSELKTQEDLDNFVKAAEKQGFYVYEGSRIHQGIDNINKYDFFSIGVSGLSSQVMCHVEGELEITSLSKWLGIKEYWDSNKSDKPSYEEYFMVSNCKRQYEEVQCLYYGEEICLVRLTSGMEQHFHIDSIEIKSVEDFQEDLELIEMSKDLFQILGVNFDQVRCSGIANLLYKKGYRKQEQSNDS